jgi:hypothetical protein
MTTAHERTPFRVEPEAKLDGIALNEIIAAKTAEVTQHSRLNCAHLNRHHTTQPPTTQNLQHASRPASAHASDSNGNLSPDLDKLVARYFQELAQARGVAEQEGEYRCLPDRQPSAIRP